MPATAKEGPTKRNRKRKRGRGRRRGAKASSSEPASPSTLTAVNGTQVDTLDIAEIEGQGGTRRTEVGIQRPQQPCADPELGPRPCATIQPQITDTTDTDSIDSSNWSIEILGTDGKADPPPKPPSPASILTMPAPARARSLNRSHFVPMFAKLKTSTYTDTPRPSSTHNIRTLSWNCSGSLIATGAADRTLRIWNPEKTNAKNSTELRGHQGAVERVNFHPLSETELASCGSDGMLRIWDVRSKASVGEVKVNGEALFLEWKPDGSEIVVGRKDNTLIPVSRSTLTPLAEYHQPIQTNQCCFNWSENHLFVTNGDGCVKILRYPSFETAYTLMAHTSSCHAAAMSPSGAYLAIGGSDALISLWDTQEWICMRTLEEMSGPVKSVSFSFDGSYIVGGSDEGTRLSIAHTETGEYVHHIDTAYPAAHVAWHPCRYVLAYSAEAQGLKIVGGIGG